ncbi:ATP synthase F1 subunit gamma [Neolewinella lacunae]|uniref:ATP synthase gamma chain n=1 Tax=Neolewinella lacunae TaxID=1517758 RepID=A0A923PI99_9BACT|nr:ATP synthase F1 subunit gamma [Neolewinella lacunae]MBC6993201.1 ATP synthase F1 subunit gamma [Neolewinella lacunae]MDN3637120.1 ATP synthase F1 subunit gamma [Neolewinella lacunae]
MANLKEVRERIGSVQNTRQITSAMKMVSAAKMSRAAQRITEMRPYALKLNEMLTNILSNLEGDASTSFNQVRPVGKACMVVVTSSRGLAGAFNTNVIKAAVQAIEEDLKGAASLDIICIGKKGAEYFRRNYGKRPGVTINVEYQELFQDLSFDNTKQVPELIMNRFAAGVYDRVYVAYSLFKNAAVQFARAEQFLPVEDKQADKEKKKTKADYIFEPSKEVLLKELVPTILKTTFQSYLLDTNASEHGARMTAMDKATENASELLKELKISYNKARQEAITTEILEIVSGAAALEAG